MDTQFCHHNKKYGTKYTIAAMLPTASDFSKLIENEKREITLPVGIANCSPKDNYCRKSGREVALSRMTPITFELKSIEFVESDIYFHFVATGFSARSMRLKMSPKSSRLHMIEAY
jgi:hypothetical protein